MLREAGIAVARSLLGTVNAAVPKMAKAVLAGFPDGEDSTLEIARHLAARPDLQTIVLTESGKPPSAAMIEGAIWCKRSSLRGLFHFLTARHVFFTHGLYLSPKPPRSQTCVNVWHGMPIKRIGQLIGRTPPRATVVLATSDLFRSLVATCFGVSEREVLATGIPRNDVMVRAGRRATAIKAKLGLAAPGSATRLIIWLPTFRQAVRGIVRTDGRAHHSVFGMDDMDVQAFSSFLAERNCVCIVKPHPMAADVSDTFESDWVKIWRERDLQRAGLSLYEVVGAADLLITDASSVYVDYLILDRPVVIAFPDIEEYRSSRGFALEPVDEFFAGPVVTSFASLCQAVDDALRRDDHKERRGRIAAMFHNHRDEHATERLLSAVLSPNAAFR